MPQKIRAAQRTVNTLSANYVGQNRGLWVTDALLSETFDRFCRAPRRYGSNVPGPLEARRRASRRKNTGLAYAGAAEPSVYDSTVLLDTTAIHEWWKRSKSAPAKAENERAKSRQEKRLDRAERSLLPAWLLNTKTKNSRCPPTEAQQSDAKSEKSLDGLKEGSDIAEIEQKFRSALATTTSLESIRSAIGEMELNLKWHPHLAESAFRHLLNRSSRSRDMDDLVKALHDPMLNPPGSSNCLAWTQQLSSDGIDRHTWLKHIFPAFLKAIELGLVPVQDLQVVTIRVPEIHKFFQEPSVATEIIAEWNRILDAIEESRVIQLKDLHGVFLSKWYRHVVNLSPSHDSCSLRWRLRHFSGTSELQLAAKITIEKVTERLVMDDEALNEVAEWIGDLPDHLQGPTVVQATFTLIELVLDRQPLAKDVVKNWSLILNLLPSDTILKANKTSWLDGVIDKCDLAPMQRALAVIWVATQLQAQQSESQILAIETILNEELMSAFKVTSDLNQLDNLADLLLTMDTLPLPEKDRILPLLERLTNRKITKLWENKSYVTGLKRCFELEYAQLRDNVFTHKLKYSLPHVLTAFTESVNTDLPQFTALAQNLIFKSDQNFRIVRAILDHNMQLRFAALKSWPSQLIQEVVPRSPEDIQPAAVLDMLEKITMAFAVTPVATPRQAFREVYKMYLFLHKISAPINPVIIRALWHAGVTRYGEVGACRTQVDWCLFKVREAEGAEVAYRLLWSTGFRRAFVRDAVQLIREMEEVDECPEDLRDIPVP